MFRHVLLITLLTGSVFQVFGQFGCTDPQATNYNAFAISNDGSCTYATTSMSLTNPRNLPDMVKETSGLAYTDGKLWTLNDSGNEAAIYRISETNGSILQTVTITNATNVDWEDIAADANYLYIGDFGNNTHGNRDDLKIYRINKHTIGNGPAVNVTADIIDFSYSDQDPLNLPPSESNNTEFDCEAFFVKDNLLHLFTKDWVAAMAIIQNIIPYPVRQVHI